VPGEKREAAARVQVLANRRDGDEFFRGAIPENAPAPAAASDPAAASGTAAQPAARVASKASFDAAPGRMQLRIAVQNAEGKTIDTIQQEVGVADMSQAGAVLSTPSVFRARTAREFQSLSRDPDPVPTALREFRRTDRLLVKFRAFSADAQAPEVTVRLLNRVGQRMTDLAAQPPAEPGGVYLLDIPLAGLSPGEYVIEVGSKGPSGPVTELIAIKVVS
jgi:hypothetical protein